MEFPIPQPGETKQEFFLRAMESKGLEVPRPVRWQIVDESWNASLNPDKFHIHAARLICLALDDYKALDLVYYLREDDATLADLLLADLPGSGVTWDPVLLTYLKGKKRYSTKEVWESLTRLVEARILRAVLESDLPTYADAVLREALEIDAIQTLLAKGGFAHTPATVWFDLSDRAVAIAEEVNAVLLRWENQRGDTQETVAPAASILRSRAQQYRQTLRDEAAHRHTLERAITGADPCPDCVARAALGWVPIGALTEETRCRWNCHCYFEYK